ncbi:uridylate kinase [Candidatus Photodesmus katoptron]|uniref:Uridylate kinase n=1 Tax=Candidatus Photodesmus katoptron Akat1 TaxID=1236703 RepID=S3EIB5_9GAMM|nr:UMP kinase [Candidatus Photodesmus katoptron]EPE37928.1 UMP kinase [Candidatus Photodesmus katoptron Akat1]KEY90352.1 uridylate kinase [Candidatus Photodesmus katoptron]
MIMNLKPIYHRILLKLSGEALQGKEKYGIDPVILHRIAKELKEIVKLGVQIGIVVGGGNLFRGAALEKAGMNRIMADHMGMVATVMNGLALYDTFQRLSIKTRLVSAISLNSICDNYNFIDVINQLDQGYVLIFTAGTGNPFFTTDSAACLRGIEIEADIVLKATKVDGIFSEDPISNPGAKLYKQLSYNDVIKKELQIMDLSAFILARDHKMPIYVFNMNKPGMLYKVVMGKAKGTLICNE